MKCKRGAAELKASSRRRPRLKEADGALPDAPPAASTLIFKILHHCLTYGPTKYQRRHLVGHQAAQIASTPRSREAVKMHNQTLQHLVSII